MRTENVENSHHTLLRAGTSCTHETLLLQTTNFLFAVSSCGCRTKATGSFKSQLCASIVLAPVCVRAYVCVCLIDQCSLQDSQGNILGAAHVYSAPE